MFTDPNKEENKYKAFVLAMLMTGGMTVAEAKKLFNYVVNFKEQGVTYLFENATVSANKTADFFAGQVVSMPDNATLTPAFNCANGAKVSLVSTAKSVFADIPNPVLPEDFAERLMGFVCDSKSHLGPYLICFMLFLMAAAACYVVYNKCTQPVTSSLKNDLAAATSYGLVNSSSDVEEGLKNNKTENNGDNQSYQMKTFK